MSAADASRKALIMRRNSECVSDLLIRCCLLPHADSDLVRTWRAPTLERVVHATILACVVRTFHRVTAPSRPWERSPHLSTDKQEVTAHPRPMSPVLPLPPIAPSFVPPLAPLEPLPRCAPNGKDCAPIAGPNPRRSSAANAKRSTSIAVLLPSCFEMGASRTGFNAGAGPLLGPSNDEIECFPFPEGVTCAGCSTSIITGSCTEVSAATYIPDCPSVIPGAADGPPGRVNTAVPLGTDGLVAQWSGNCTAACEGANVDPSRPDAPGGCSVAVLGSCRPRSSITPSAIPRVPTFITLLCSPGDTALL